MIPGCTNTKLYRWTGTGCEQADAADVPGYSNGVYPVGEPPIEHVLAFLSARYAAMGVTGKQSRPPARKPFRPRRTRRDRRAVCVETGVEYAGVIAASKATGISRRAIFNAMVTGHRAGGVHWCEPGQLKHFKPARDLCRPVQCVENGNVFRSLRAAAAHLGCCKDRLAERIESGAAFHGWHWRWADPAAANNSLAEAESEHESPVPSVASLPASSMLQHHHSQRAGDGRDGSFAPQLVVSNGVALQGAAA